MPKKTLQDQKRKTQELSKPQKTPPTTICEQLFGSKPTRNRIQTSKITLGAGGRGARALRSAAPSGTGVFRILTGRVLSGSPNSLRIRSPGHLRPCRQPSRNISFSIFFRSFSVSEFLLVFYIVFLSFFSILDLEMEAEIHQTS